MGEKGDQQCRKIFQSIIARCRMQTWPVSYTHLDVYKRQVNVRSFSPTITRGYSFPAEFFLICSFPTAVYKVSILIQLPSGFTGQKPEPLDLSADGFWPAKSMRKCDLVLHDTWRQYLYWSIHWPVKEEHWLPWQQSRCIPPELSEEEETALREIQRVPAADQHRPSLSHLPAEHPDRGAGNEHGLHGGNSHKAGYGLRRRHKWKSWLPDVYKRQM